MITCEKTNGMLQIKEPEAVYSLGKVELHAYVERVLLYTGSDAVNHFVAKEKFVPLPRKNLELKGKIFFVKCPLEKRTLIVISETPDCIDATLRMKDGELSIDTQDCPIAYGWCDFGKEEETVRKYFVSKISPATYSMVNNWGGGNAGKNITYDFFVKEIDAASEMGIKIVQIDDGWQMLSPADTKIYTEDKVYTYYHRFDGNFWDLNTEKFPDGFAPLVKYAASKNVILGLWFAPDTRDDMANFDRDVAVLRKAYFEWGFRFFKLDMVVLKTVSQRKRFIEFLDVLSSFGDDVRLQIDVTAPVARLGFLDGFSYGKVFVENRYFTRTNYYYPHDTLRNLWALSRYIPAQKIQMEIPDITKCDKTYDRSDVLAPFTYTMDYIVASVMFSNPLFWMELQFLPEKDYADAKRVMDVWQAQKDDLANCDIYPIGDEPDGTTLTGFMANGNGYGYFIALREVTDEDTMSIELPFKASKLEVLCSNFNSDATLADGKATVKFGDKRAFVFCRFE